MWSTRSHRMLAASAATVHAAFSSFPLLHGVELTAADEATVQHERGNLVKKERSSFVPAIRQEPRLALDLRPSTEPAAAPGAWQEVRDELLETAQIKPDGTTLVLDLDETLIHARHMNFAPDLDEDANGVFVRTPIHRADLFDLVSQCSSGTFCMRVQIRPFLKEFLTAAFDTFDNVVVYTAGSERYARGVCGFLLSLVPGRRFSEILDRRYTMPHIDTETHSRSRISVQVKDLERLGVDMSKVVMLDDHWEAIVQVENVLPVCRYTGEHNDRALLWMMPQLKQLVMEAKAGQDMRSVIAVLDEKRFADNYHVIEQTLRKEREMLGGKLSRRMHHWQKEAALQSLKQRALDKLKFFQEQHPEGEIQGDDHMQVILKKIAVEMAHDTAHKASIRLGQTPETPRRWPKTVSSHILARCTKAKETSALLEIQQSRELAKKNHANYSDYQLANAAGITWNGSLLTHTRVPGGPKVLLTNEQSTHSFLPAAQAEHAVACSAQVFGEPPTVLFHWDVPHTAHVGGDEHWA